MPIGPLVKILGVTTIIIGPMDYGTSPTYNHKRLNGHVRLYGSQVLTCLRYARIYERTGYVPWRSLWFVQILRSLGNTRA